MRYEKNNQILIGGNVCLKGAGIALFKLMSNYCFLAVFFKITHEKYKKEYLIGISRHVEVKIVYVGRNGDAVSVKWFKSERMSCKVGRKCVGGDIKCMEGDRFFIDVDGNRFVGRGKWNNGNIKCSDVNGKCFIVRKKTKKIRNKQYV